MKKHFGKLLFAAILLIAVIAALVYTRPMTLEQLCPGLDFSYCQGAKAYYWINEDGVSPEDIRVKLQMEDVKFSDLFVLFQGQTFRRTLRNLLPPGGMTHRTQEGDYKWEVIFQFEDMPFSDGSLNTGDILHVRNFFGKVTVSFNGVQWHTATADQESWLRQVLDVLLQSKSTA